MFVLRSTYKKLESHLTKISISYEAVLARREAVIASLTADITERERRNAILGQQLAEANEALAKFMPLNASFADIPVCSTVTWSEGSPKETKKSKKKTKSKNQAYKE